MNELKKWNLRFRILVMRYLRAPSFLITAALMLVLQLFLGTAALPSASSRDIGLVHEGIAGNAVAEDLLSMNGAYTWTVFDTEEELKDAVATGETDCGFVLASSLDDAVSKRPDPETNEFGMPDLSGSIHYIRSTTTTKGEAAKEEVYSALLRYLAPIVVADGVASGQLLEHTDEEARTAVTEEMKRIIEADELFKVRFEVYGDDSEAGESGTDDVGLSTDDGHAAVRQVTCILLFAGLLLFASSWFRKETETILSFMRGRGWIYQVLEIFIPLLLTGVLLSIPLVTQHAVRIPQILLLVVLLIGASIWGSLFVRLFRHEAVYLFLAVVLIAAAVVFGSSAGDVPVLTTVRWIRYLLPATWFRAVIG